MAGLVVELSEAGDNSVVTVSEAAMQNLKVFRGDAVLLRGETGKDTVCVIVTDNEVEDSKIRMNEVVRQNLQAELSSIVTVEAFTPGYAQRVHVLPVSSDNLESVTEDLLEGYLKPYFEGAYRPVRSGDLFLVKDLEFMVAGIDVDNHPDEYAIVSPETVLDCSGEPVKKD